MVRLLTAVFYRPPGPTLSWFCLTRWLPLLFLLAGCEPQAIKVTHQLPLTGVIFDQFSSSGQKIGYARYGSKDGEPVIFIHGSPGSWADFKSVLADKQLGAQYCLVAVDRPGWGRSGNQVETSLQKSAELLHPATSVCSSREPAILVGYSLGGPIAARLAADYPDSINGLLLISPSIDPDLRPVRWFNKLADTVIIRSLIGDMMAKSNNEILPLENELRQLAPLLPNITAPVIILQGERDGLVDPANALYVKKMIPNQSTTIRFLNNSGHLIPFEKPGHVVEAVLALDAEGHTRAESREEDQPKNR